MAETHVIVPGKSIGPFELGMTREQLEGLHVRPMQRLDDGGAYFPLVQVSEGELRRWGSGPHPGVVVSYDADGRCCSIQALFADHARPPLFSLLGQLVNGMTYAAASTLLRAIASDVTCFYGSVSSRSAGVSATPWEASDDCIMAVTVRPASPPD